MGRVKGIPLSVQYALYGVDLEDLSVKYRVAGVMHMADQFTGKEASPLQNHFSTVTSTKLPEGITLGTRVSRSLRSIRTRDDERHNRDVRLMVVPKVGFIRVMVARTSEGRELEATLYNNEEITALLTHLFADVHTCHLIWHALKRQWEAERSTDRPESVGSTAPAIGSSRPDDGAAWHT